MKSYRDLIGKRQSLEVSFEIEDRETAIDIDKRTVEMSILSDQPIQQWWFGRVILEHKKSAVRMDRMNAGAPLLLNHRTDQQIGILENVRLQDGKLRATARFSRSALAEEIFQDVRDGIRRNTSGGFVIHEIKLEKKKDGEPDTYRALDWEPFEGSIASIPADITVGAGRSADLDDEEEESGANVEEETARAGARSADPPPTPEVRTTIMTEQERLAAEAAARANNPLVVLETRTNDFVRFALIYANTDEQKRVLTEIAREFAITGKSEDELKAKIQEQRTAWAAAAPSAMPKLTESEKRQYSISRAILADASMRDRAVGGDTQCLEMEISQDIEKRVVSAGYKHHGGIFMPTGLSLRGLQQPDAAGQADFVRFMQQMFKRAGLDTLTDTKGLELIFTEPGSFIDLLRKRTMVIQLGATVLAGLQGNVAFPKQIGAGTFSWVAENPGSDVADSNLTLDQVLLSPKTGMSSTSYSRQLLRQGVVDVDGLVMTDLAKINALGIDLAALHGLGTTNQPRGIYNTSGIGSVTFGGAITFAKVVAMETAIAAVDADIGTMAYLTTPNVRGAAKTTLVASAAGSAMVWQNGEMNGYRAEATNQILKTLGTGSDHGILFGVWAELMIGEWGALEIITDPYRLKKQGMIEVTSFVMVDVAPRYPEAFCKGLTLTAV